MMNINSIVDAVMQKVETGMVNINWRSYARQASPSQREGSRKGHGTELHGFKEYDPADGDSAGDIDHIASASESEDGVFILRINKQPAVTSLTVVVDVNDSMKAGTGTSGYKSYLAAIAAGCGISCADKYRDRTSVVTYSNQPITLMKLADARRALYPAVHACIEDHHALLEYAATAPKQSLLSRLKNLPASLRTGFSSLVASLKKLIVRIRAGFNWKGLVKTLAKPDSSGGGLSISLRETNRQMRGVFLIVSDFVNMNDEDWFELQACGSDHDTVAVFVQDKRERELPRAPFPGMSYRVTDFRGQSVALWIVPDRLPFGLRQIGKALGFLFGWLLAKPFAWVFGKRTTREQWAENFKVYEDAILRRLQECGVNTVVMRTDDEEAVAQLLQVLASTSR
ncbi:MAG: hypothetical protein P4L53_06475 [Candidatus Obscuribacterales bacterium]|nr:hypothetical protein [Candidatus Obscuribacterales bacterium]